MKFREIFRYELAYQIRRPWPWLIIIVLMFLTFLFMRDGSFSEALYTEFFVNSPFMIAMATVFGSLLWLLTGAFITGEAAARDIEARMHALIYTTPITKAEYLGGRYLASFVVHACILIVVQITIILAIYLPGVHPDSIGPFRPQAFITAYFFIALPNAFAATTLQFALALWSGRPIAAYMGSLALFFTAFFIASLILFRSGLGTLLDPIGVRFIWDELSHLWTTVEKSHRLIELNGVILQNRLVWICVGSAIAALTYFRFVFSHRVDKNFKYYITKLKFRTEKKAISETITSTLANTGKDSKFQISHVKLSFGFRFHVRQVLTIAWISFRAIATSWTGLALLVFIPLLAIPVIIDQMVAMSVPLVPTTALVIKELTGPLSADMSRWMVIPGFIIYFVGELVWRERDHNLSDITDAMPGSDWAPLLGKFLAISLLMAVFMAALTTSGILAQVLMEHTNFELGLYVKMMFGLQLPEYILFAMLALFIHSVVNQKYVGHLVAILAYAFIAAIATMLGIEHNLWIYGAGPGWSYTEMLGFGNSIEPWLWFKLYWAAWALLLSAGATLFWSRGKERGFGVRMQLARYRVSKSTMWVMGIATTLIIAFGGFVFYNTNIRHHYRSSAEANEWRAAYERRYAQYEHSPGPRLQSAKMNVEIYPDRRAVDMNGTYTLINNSDVAIDSMHVSTPTGGAILKLLTFDRKATLALDDAEYAYRIYKFEIPLKPGDSLKLSFEVTVESRGFMNHGAERSVAKEGSYFTNQGWCPSIGFQRQRTLIHAADRRAHGLEPRELMASLYQSHEGDAPSLDGGIAFEATIGTSQDQVAVAPGTLNRTWTENSRNYFHYSTSKPIGSDWAFFSANYEVHEGTWTPSDSTAGRSKATPVTVRIFHHPGHTAHREHMISGIQASLAYYSKEFGEYPYSHLTFVEHPYAPGTGMHAEPSLVYYGQGYPYWLSKNENRLDFPYAVMGHEMAHQWTLPLAMVEGLPFMSEGLAWYSGIMMVKETRGQDQTQQLLSFLRQPYPHQPIRRGEPLLRGLDPYLSYRRGPFAMYALTEYIGTAHVNGALKNLVARDSAGAALITTLDLYRELEAVTPDSMKYLLHDLFEVNTLWEFETTGVRAIETMKGTWEVTLDIHARKFVYDSAGVETDLSMSELIPIGIFAEQKPGRSELSEPLYLQKNRIHSGDQSITITVKGKPVLGGIDPFHLLDWEEKEDDDNIEPVVITNAERDH